MQAGLWQSSVPLAPPTGHGVNCSTVKPTQPGQAAWSVQAEPGRSAGDACCLIQVVT